MHDPAVSEEVLRYIQQLPRDQCLVAFMSIEKLVVHLGELGIVGSSTPIDAAPTPESAEPPSIGVMVELVRSELRDIVDAMDVEIDVSGCPHNPSQDTGSDPIQDMADTAEASIVEGGTSDLSDGTAFRPFPVPDKSEAPLREYDAPGYVTLAWPMLFPLGRGDHSEAREQKISWSVWSTHLQKFYEGRFAQHARWPYFALNTKERSLANRQATLYVRQPTATTTTVGELRQLCKQDKRKIFGELSKFGSTLRNTPAFFQERRKDLYAMIEQLGARMRRLARSSPPSSARLWADATGRRKKWRT